MTTHPFLPDLKFSRQLFDSRPNTNIRITSGGFIVKIVEAFTDWYFDAFWDITRPSGPPNSPKYVETYQK